MRLDKFTAQQLGVSRAIAGREIRGSRVTVDSDITKDTSSKLQPKCEVEHDGNTLTRQDSPRCFMLNKPQDYACSIDDPDHPTISYFLDEPVAYKLHAAGHLDVGTTGLVLMIDDDQWSHHITSPRHHCEKTYLVELGSPLAEGTIELLAKGVQLHNEKDLTKPAVLEVVTPTGVRLIISEGRYHQMKRMFAAVGNHVVGLHRERIDDILLDDALALGEYRPLTGTGIASVSAPQVRSKA